MCKTLTAVLCPIIFFLLPSLSTGMLLDKVASFMIRFQLRFRMVVSSKKTAAFTLEYLLKQFSNQAVTRVLLPVLRIVAALCSL